MSSFNYELGHIVSSEIIIKSDLLRQESFPYVPHFSQVINDFNSCIYEALEAQIQKAQDIFDKTIPSDSKEREEYKFRLNQSIENIQLNLEFYRNRISDIKANPLTPAIGGFGWLTSLQQTLGYGREANPKDPEHMVYFETLLGNTPESAKLLRTLRTFEALVDQFESYVEPMKNKIILIENIKKQEASFRKKIIILSCFTLFVLAASAYLFKTNDKQG